MSQHLRSIQPNSTFSALPIPDEDIRHYLRSVSATAHRQLVKGRQRFIDGMALRLPREVYNPSGSVDIPEH